MRELYQSAVDGVWEVAVCPLTSLLDLLRLVGEEMKTFVLVARDPVGHAAPPANQLATHTPTTIAQMRAATPIPVMITSARENLSPQSAVKLLLSLHSHPWMAAAMLIVACFFIRVFSKKNMPCVVLLGYSCEGLRGIAATRHYDMASR